MDADATKVSNVDPLPVCIKEAHTCNEDCDANCALAHTHVAACGTKVFDKVYVPAE